jgi:putative ABC transport system ATP-binding protein
MSPWPTNGCQAPDRAPAPPEQIPGETAVLIRGLNHYFGTGENRKPALIDNNLTLEPGAMVVMTGPSGSGKTTLLTLIGALRTVQEGSVRVLDRELNGMSAQQLMQVRRDIGFIFQAHNLFEVLSARQNVRMALELKQGRSPREMDRLADEMLTRLGLGHRLEYKPAQMSGGQKQRVAIARALVNRPALILADEPTAALDKEFGHTVVELLKEMAQKEGSTILLVTHDSRILDVADRIVNMIDGRIVSEVLVEETVSIIENLVKCPLFAQESPAALTEISQHVRKERYPAGSTIVRQGEEGDRFYMIRQGEVEVRRDEGGAEPLVVTLGPGDFFGEAALLTGQPRNATVVAREETTVYTLKKAEFQSALHACPALKEQLLTVFSSRRGG